MLPFLLVGLLLAVSAASTEATSTPSLSIHSLTTEYLTDPLGVDVKNPRLSWILEASNGDRGVYQTNYQIQVSSTWDPVTNAPKQWTCPVVASSKSYLVHLLGEEEDEEGFCEGLTLRSDTHYEWHVQVTVQQMGGSMQTLTSPKASFRTGLLEDGDWQAEWITGGNIKTMLRTTFQTSDSNLMQSHATLFISGVGYYEAFLNGQKVGDHVLDVGWTDYEKRVWYATHDVTDLLQRSSSTQQQQHVLGVLLGNSWWSCGPLPGTNQPMCSHDPPQLKLQLQIDGKPVLTSHARNDTQWQAMTGPIVFNSLYMGETYDARIAEQRIGWASDVNFRAEDSTPVQAAHSVVNNATLTSQLFEPIRHVSTWPPVSISILNYDQQNLPNSNQLTQVLDFGQNTAGVVRLKKINCPRGTSITLRHAELLLHPPYGDHDGSIYVENLRSAKATDVYICSGDPKGESYTPTFTQHGFRYVEVTGLEYPLKEEDIEIVEVHTDVKQASTIDLSDPLLNQIQHLCYWGQKTNLMSVPTDCPQRDERRGWMGDAALSSEIAAYNFHIGAFYSRWLLQIVDDQNPDGSVPDVVPHLAKSNSNIPGAPNWQSAFPTIIWVLINYYGDTLVPTQHHDALVRYYDYLQREYEKTGIKEFRQGYGDWCQPPPHPPSNKHLLGSFALIHDLQLGTKIFSASRHPEAPSQAERCQKLLDKVMGEYHEAFFDAKIGLYGSGLQTEQVLPLFLGAVPAAYKDEILDSLVHDIQVTHANHTTSGIIGIKFGMEILSALGRSDVALELARQKTYPSWGYMVNNPYEPATTVWELWQAPVFGPGMNSRNHIMFGTVSSWFFKYLAGIQPMEPGYKQISIQPSGQSALDHASAKIATPYGDILSSWEKRNEAYTHTVTIPPGATATLLIPLPVLSQRDNFTIMEGDAIVWEKGAFVSAAPGVVAGVQLAESIEFQLSNGRYVFQTGYKINLRAELSR